MSSQHRPRLFLMAIAGLSLLAALWAGLARSGWDWPQPTSNLPMSHGPLMVVGFLGTLISLERAVAFKRLWGYGASLFAGIGSLVLLVGSSVQMGHILATAGSLILLCIFVVLYWKQPTGFMATMGLGASLWFVGNLLWHGGFSLDQVVPWWIGFLVLTIAGERLELSRLMRLSTWSRAGFFFANGVFLIGLLVGFFAFDVGLRLGGLGLVALALWLLRCDIAWRTLRQAGLPRFMAISLIIGYIWLWIGGLLWIVFADLFTAGPYYDAMVHSIFLGFVLSMIFAHAPIIFPSVMGVAMPFREAFYGHLVLLHLSLALRVGADLALWRPGQRWGSLLNVLAILLFLANNVRAVKLGQSEALLNLRKA